MKNPIKFFKHLWKDPVTTIDEANKRKKEILPVLYISIAIAVVPSALGAIIPAIGFLSFFSIFGGAGVIFSIFLLFILKKAKEKFEALTCVNCKKMAAFSNPEEYSQCVSYTVSGNKAVYAGISHPESKDGVISNVTASASASASVSIQLKCPHCQSIKPLRYDITPFKCSYSQSKVAVRDLELVKSRLEPAVKEVVEAYNDSERNEEIPYSIHSKKNPDYENRTKPQFGDGYIPLYKGVKINYRKDVDEMVYAFFMENQLDGKIIDPSKPAKNKK